MDFTEWPWPVFEFCGSEESKNANDLLEQFCQMPCAAGL